MSVAPAHGKVKAVSPQHYPEVFQLRGQAALVAHGYLEIEAHLEGESEGKGNSCTLIHRYDSLLPFSSFIDVQGRVAEY